MSDTRKVKHPAFPRASVKYGKTEQDGINKLAESTDVLLGRRGDSLDRALTPRDLIDIGLLIRNPFSSRDFKSTLDGLDGYYYPAAFRDPVQPTKPTNVKVTATFNNAFIQWDEAVYDGHAFAEIWRNTSNNLASAVLRGTAQGVLYNDEITSGTTYYYWVRFVNRADPPVYGPWHDTNGATVTTPLSPSDVSDILVSELNESHLVSALNTRIDYIDTNGGFTGTGLLSDTSNLNVRVTSAEGTLTLQGTSISANAASISATNATVSSQGTTITAHASDIAQVQATIGDDSAMVSTIMDVLGTSDSAGMRAQYMVKTDVNGKVAGFGVYNDGGSSEFVIAADKFAISSPSVSSGASKFPFVVGTVNGSTAISMNASTFIEDATITTAAIANAAIDSAQIADLAVVTGKIENGSITNAKIANLAVNTAQIAAAAITTAKIRDAAVETAKIRDAAVETLKIGDNEVTVPVVATSTSVLTGNGSTADRLTAAITTNVASDILVFWMIEHGYSSGGAGFKLRVYNNNTGVNLTRRDTAWMTNLADYVAGAGTITQITPGTTTIKLNWGGENSNIIAGRYTLVCIAAQK